MKNLTRSREDRLRALVDVGRAISASLAHEDILAQICSHAARLLDAESAVMTERMTHCEQFGGPCLKVVATSPQARIGLGEHLSMQDSLNGLAITSQRTLIVNDVYNDPRADQAVAAKLGSRQVVIAPLCYGSESLGTIFAFNAADDREFDEADSEILEAFAAQASIALHNAHIFEAETRRLEELTRLRAAQDENLKRMQALIRIGMALNSRASLDEVLQTLIDSAREVIRARYAALGVLDASGASLTRFLYSGIDPEAWARIGRWPTGGGTLGIMLRQARAVRIRDLQQHPDFAGFPGGHPQMRSLLGVPLKVGQSVFGNLYLTEKIGADEFTAEDQRLAELLAAQAAIAVENAHLAEQRGQFLAIVNHEIKNAAAGVVGWTDRLRKLTSSTENPKIAESAGFAFEGAQQLHRLVVDLLDLSRIEARQLELDLQDVDLRALIREVLATLTPSADRQGVKLRSLGLDERLIIGTDPTRVRQILLNLLSNAIKFSREGESVDLTVKVCDGSLLITVCDRGPGVDPALRDQVFEAYRLANSRQSKGGSGLGLAISRELARVLGGELDHLQGDAPGACFQLRLPARPARKNDGPSRPGLG